MCCLESCQYWVHLHNENILSLAEVCPCKEWKNTEGISLINNTVAEGRGSLKMGVDIAVLFLVSNGTVLHSEIYCGMHRVKMYCEREAMLQGNSIG